VVINDYLFLIIKSDLKFFNLRLQLLKQIFLSKSIHFL